MSFLLFTLYAPMSSLGEIAVGERRMGWPRPSRSAVLGLVAAAMGFKRVEEDAHQSLEAGLFYAVRTDAPGRPFIDYHTAQPPKKRKNRTFATRREELRSASGLYTVLSSREWRSDACFTIALWPRQNEAIDIDAIADALRKPRFVLYLGRKSAPLGLPLNPAIVDTDTFTRAFAARQRTGEEEAVLKRIHMGSALQAPIACDYDAPVTSTHIRRIERRRDVVISRGRWQFADRLEYVINETKGSEE